MKNSNDEHKKSSSRKDETIVDKNSQAKKFGTFSGVFTPTLLTILGVIMFLREGWVVGNAGLLGAWIIILLSFTITTFTALSLSSIVTNIKMGAGGAFSVISQSLGLEVGGSIGVPLYLSQALAVSMYIFGFRSGWLWIFPNHSPLMVDLIAFIVIFGIAYVSAGLAFKIQYFIMAIIGISLVSIAVAAVNGSMQYSVEWWGGFQGSLENNFSGVSFWAVFAVFFPASTGIMAGANMSGELKNPRKNIPLGTISAILLSIVIYLALAYWLARSATNKELLENYTVMIDKAAWGLPVLAGLLGATFSSALSSLVGAPRILQALGAHNIIPKGQWFSKKSPKGEPRNSLFVTGAIVLVALMLRDLNIVAPLITMFFLITYAMINLVVLIEQNLKLISFRPFLKIPKLISLLGSIGCIFAMFIINPAFSLVAIAIVLVLYSVLIRRHLHAPFGDVRSGLFVALAEWAVKKVSSLPVSRERTWKANLLIPVETENEISKLFYFIKNVAFPKGFIKLVGLTGKETEEELTNELDHASEKLKDEDIFTSWTVITAADFGENLKAGIETFGGTFFKPNIILLTMPDDAMREAEVKEILTICRKNKIGVLLLNEHKDRSFGSKDSINIWFKGLGPKWSLEEGLTNHDLALLIAYKFKLNWQADLRLVGEIQKKDEKENLLEFLSHVSERARIPNVKSMPVIEDHLNEAPQADLNIFPLPETIVFEELRSYNEKFNSSCLFTLDSEEENALA
jgi:amino acid transporter